MQPHAHGIPPSRPPNDISASASANGLIYGAAEVPWPEALGNHRVRVHVAHKADAVWVHIPWRRRDRDPEAKAVFVVDAATDTRVDNVLAVTVNRECGDLIFQPRTAPGDYWVYFMPCHYEGWKNSPTVVYEPPTATADPAWAATCAALVQQLKAGHTAGLPAAQAVEIQAINAFHRFDPMEVIATADEMKRLLSAQADKPYLLFPEDRTQPIRMLDELPQRWIEAGPRNAFQGEAARGEFYAFQIGLYAVTQSVLGLQVEFGDLQAGTGASISAAALRCINLGGTDWLGRALRKRVDVAQGGVQPLWFGVQVPADARPGTYTGTLRLCPANAPATAVTLALTVTEQVLADAGDREPWRHARLRWLDSTIGLDDEVPAPFTPVTQTGRTFGLLGRSVRINEVGFPESIQSTFTRNVDGTDAPPRELLAAPVRLAVDNVQWDGRAAITRPGPGAAAWTSTSTAGDLTLDCAAKLECDGYINYRLTLRARAATLLKEVVLEVPLRREAVPYMMGLGRKGGLRPAEWQWQWDVNRANGQLWIGDINAGLSLKLKHVTDTWDLYNMKQTGSYRDWSNDGRGGCTVREEGDRVVIRASTGPRQLAAGEAMQLN
ncbi:MAG: hypothetical protein KA257_07545, partial [Opitutaceae bacterium]|nr:hypothetical protein [Opitutaceae bacterium]